MKKILQGQAATKITVSGKIVLTNKDDIESIEPVILFKHHTEPDDLQAVLASGGIVTVVGGTLSHASIVAREFNKGGIIACKDLVINLEGNYIKIGNQIVHAGTPVFVDGTTGSVYLK